MLKLRGYISISLLLTTLVGLTGQDNRQDYYKFRRLRDISSRDHHEVLPVIYRDGLVYLDNRNTGGVRSIKIETEGAAGSTAEQDQAPASIYYIEKKENNSWGSPRLFARELTTNYFDGPVSFANDYTLICFSRLYLDDRGRPENGNTGIFFADYSEDEKWVNIREFEHNDPDVSYYAPFITPNGRELYFSAIMPDSRGGFDIYVSKYRQGQWTEPENLGDNINTAAHERHPFKHGIGRLYFSRKAVDGSDDGDLYYSAFYNEQWNAANPMASPRYNTASDELSIYIDDFFTSGYITRRLGPTYDVYWFFTDYPALKDPEKIKRPALKYRIYDRKMDTVDTDMFFYEWVINDTLHLPGHEVIYRFPGPGKYKLSLDIHNKLTDTVENGAALFNLEIPQYEQPVFNFLATGAGQVNPDTITVGQMIELDASETYLPGLADEKEYFWDFGDGNKAEGISVTHAFETPGDYRIVLGVRSQTENEEEMIEPICIYRDLAVIGGN